jgi:hypothetical protein
MRKRFYKEDKNEIEIWKKIREWYKSRGFTQVSEDMRQIKSANEPHSLYRKLQTFDDFIGISTFRDKDKLITLSKKKAKELIEMNETNLEN